jgi:hypothetical protein|tara:strand:- start:267 stop:473 length:207 start_codon:yes stop_codon:yes gene_type:complete
MCRLQVDVKPSCAAVEVAPQACFKPWSEKISSNCHNATNKTKQNKTTWLCGIIIGKTPTTTTTTTTPD